MRKEDIDAIVVHCSATRAGQDVRASDIDKWHKERGFKMIGYNYVIDLDGTVEIGRPLTMDGAHCNTAGTSGKSYNKHSIGICYEGGLDEKGRPADTRTPAQRQSLIALLRALKTDYPDAEIVGHCELEGVHKACPCFSCQEYRDYFEGLVN